ncbi:MULTISPECIES: Hsp33 family molecular chaperone HslO [Clostridium]|uniref:33 kDa chaperonin n=2 Tax=Clostridium TaxID=1485 RepID=D8GSB9_CLOLD|nr:MULTISPECIES: Hsp33 family molecular chaperone HslO [Clostridium]ADK16501.1 predicted 33 kDa chaperonin [Clostridium ljungdahlii DSM 13528]OAA89630.1 33 kDa chaperonin [Clostridium ljungdahlii DSM 13528]RMC97867.1 Hsp33 family molecular chaperone HslO [Clostridium autoethanogenum]
MIDKLIRATAKDDNIRIIAASTTNLVNAAVKIHECAPTAAAAFGRMLTAGSLMGSMLKSPKDSLSLIISGGGKAKGISVTSYADCHVKGYIGNPSADLPPNSKGKLDVGGIIGINGNLTVIRNMGLREPYSSKIPIQTGEIGDDLAYYFTVSEQTPSAVALGVLVDVDLSIKASGGFIIQMLPGAEDLLADLVTYRLQELPPISNMLAKGMSISQILNDIFKDMGLKILDELTPTYKCDCSRERVEKALISIGAKDLEEIYNEGKTEELKCNFCKTSYKFTHDQIGEILKNCTKKS